MKKLFFVTNFAEKINEHYTSLTPKGKELLNRCIQSDAQIYLEPYENFQNESLEEILNGGNFYYKCKSYDKELEKEIVIMLNELFVYATPIHIYKKDLKVVYE